MVLGAQPQSHAGLAALSVLKLNTREKGKQEQKGKVLVVKVMFRRVTEGVQEQIPNWLTELTLITHS